MVSTIGKAVSISLQSDNDEELKNAAEWLTKNKIHGYGKRSNA